MAQLWKFSEHVGMYSSRNAVLKRLKHGAVGIRTSRVTGCGSAGCAPECTSRIPLEVVSMNYVSRVRAIGYVSLAALLSGVNAQAQQIKKVFVIAMENHNWTQPANQFTGGIQQIYQNPAAPFINSLVEGTAQVTIGSHTVNISDQVAYAAAYHN